MKNTSFVYRTKEVFLNDVFRCAERDVSCGRDVCFASDVRFARAKRNTSHHFAAKPQNITMPQGITSLAPDGANIIHLFCLSGQERFFVSSTCFIMKLQNGIMIADRCNDGRATDMGIILGNTSYYSAGDVLLQKQEKIVWLCNPVSTARVLFNCSFRGDNENDEVDWL